MPSDNFSSFKEDEQKRLFEYVFWLSLFSIGVGLIFYIFWVNPGSESDSGFAENVSLTASPRSSRHKSDYFSKRRKNWIKYDGTFKTYGKIVFKLNGYDEAVKYSFDFGDGYEKDCNSDKISHYYTKPGKYNVKVKVFYDGKETEAWSETLVIREGFKIDPSAYTK